MGDQTVLEKDKVQIIFSIGHANAKFTCIRVDLETPKEQAESRITPASEQRHKLEATMAGVGVAEATVLASQIHSSSRLVSLQKPVDRSC
jgi:hypothetical protein